MSEKLTPLSPSASCSDIAAPVRRSESYSSSLYVSEDSREIVDVPRGFVESVAHHVPTTGRYPVLIPVFSSEIPLRSQDRFRRTGTHRRPNLCMQLLPEQGRFFKAIVHAHGLPCAKTDDAEGIFFSRFCSSVPDLHGLKDGRPAWDMQ